MPVVATKKGQTRECQHWMDALAAVSNHDSEDRPEVNSRPASPLEGNEEIDWWRIELAGRKKSRALTVGIVAPETGELGHLANALNAGRGPSPKSKSYELLWATARRFAELSAVDGSEPMTVSNLDRTDAPGREDGLLLVELATEATPLQMLVAFDEPTEEGSPMARVRSNVDSVADVGRLLDVELPVSVRFGKARMQLEHVLDLRSGGVVELDCSHDDPVELIVNGSTVARGELIAVDGRYAVKIVNIMNRRSCLESIGE